MWTHDLVSAPHLAVTKLRQNSAFFADSVGPRRASPCLPSSHCSCLLQPLPASTMDAAALAEQREVNSTREDEIFDSVDLFHHLLQHRRRCLDV